MLKAQSFRSFSMRTFNFMNWGRKRKATTSNNNDDDDNDDDDKTTKTKQNSRQGERQADTDNGQARVGPTAVNDQKNRDPGNPLELVAAAAQNIRSSFSKHPARLHTGVTTLRSGRRGQSREHYHHHGKLPHDERRCHRQNGIVVVTSTSIACADMTMLPSPSRARDSSFRLLLPTPQSPSCLPSRRS